MVLAAATLLALPACPAHAPRDAEPETMAPEALLYGERTRPARQSFPTELLFPESYARTWDAMASVVASRGFPLDVVARDSGLLTTGWRVTQPNHEVRLGGGRYVGRKVERVTVLVRPVEDGSAVTVSSQTALASPLWSAAAPAAGHAVDMTSDTVTEYGLLYDIGRVLGHPQSRPPDPAYGKGLARAGVLAGGGGGLR